MYIYKKMKAIKRDNPRFFAPDAMAVTDSRVESRALTGNYFITSERPVVEGGLSEQRFYTVRRALRAEVGTAYFPYIENITVLHGCPTYNDALEAVCSHRELTKLKGKHLMDEMARRVSQNGHPFGVTAFAEETRGCTLVVSTQQGYEDPLMESLTFPSAEACADTLGSGLVPMDPAWIGGLIQTAVMADEMQNVGLINRNRGIGTEKDVTPLTEAPSDV